MSWVKLDDAFGRNPKVMAVTGPARLLYVMGLCHCADQLSDGEIVASALPLLFLQADATKKQAAELVAAELWLEHAGSYWIPDFLAYNPSREKVLANREAGAVRANRSRTNSARSREVTASVRATPTPTPKTSFTDYENNAVHGDVVPFAAKPPQELRQHLAPKPLRESV